MTPHDDEILRLLRARSPDGIRLLLEVHGAAVRAAVGRILGNARAPMVEDAMTDAALKIWNCPDRLDLARGGIGSLFFVAAKNVAFRFLAAEAAHQQRERSGTGLTEVAFQSDPDRRTSPAQQSVAAALMDAIATLPWLQREVVLADLRAETQVPAKQLATRLGVRTGSVYVARHRAHARVKHHMREKGFDLESDGTTA